MQGFLGNAVLSGRQHGRQDCVVDTAGGGTSTVIDARKLANVQLLVLAGAASQTVAVHVCDAANGTFLPLYDSAGNAVSVSVVASRAYEIPALGATAFLKFVAGTSLFSAVVCGKG
jgi:hypothetical protein